MRRTIVTAAVMLAATPLLAQQEPDWSKYLEQIYASLEGAKKNP